MSPSHNSATAYNLGTVWCENVKGEMQIHGIYFDYLGIELINKDYSSCQIS